MPIVINPSVVRSFCIRLVQALILVLSWKAHSIWNPVKWIQDSTTAQSIVQKTKPWLDRGNKAVIAIAPAVQTVVLGAVIPAVCGYGVRTFEEFFNYTGRSPFTPTLHDMNKMSHYAFHAGIGSGLLGLLWRFSRNLPSDIRIASLLSGIYFYAFGRAVIMEPSESMLMMQSRYFPILAVGTIAAHRIPEIKKNLPIIAYMSGIISSMQVLSFR